VARTRSTDFFHVAPRALNLSSSLRGINSNFSCLIIAKYIARVGHHEPAPDPVSETEETSRERTQIEAAVVRFIMGVGRTRGTV
jgi:hypothetical protein